MKFLLFLGLVGAAVAVFFSGSLPYTLIYDEDSLRDVTSGSEEPIEAEVVRCDVDDTNSLKPGAALNATFKTELRNNTDRYVAISAIGEVFDPRGRSMSMNSQLFVLSPNSSEETRFMSRTPFTTAGTYTCEMRYAIGRFDY
jgi:hypothetical protein